MERYYIRTRSLGREGTFFDKKKTDAEADWTGWVECDRFEWMNAERAENFISQHPGQPATAGFTGKLIQGKIEYVREKR